MDRKAVEIAEIAEFCGIGIIPWRDFNKELSNLFPGAVPNIFVLDGAANKTLLVESDGSLLGLEEDYIEHFAPLNPWNAIWGPAKSGEPYFTSEIFPSKMFENSSFYNDWLIKTGAIQAAGMKISTLSNDIVGMSVLLPSICLGETERAIGALYRKIAGPVRRAIEMNKHLGEKHQDALVCGALVQRGSDAVFVLNPQRLVVDGNSKAIEEARQGQFVRIIRGRIHLNDPEADDRLGAIVRGAADQSSGLDDRFLTVCNGRKIQFLAARLPDVNSRYSGRFLFAQRLILLTVKDLSKSNSDGLASALRSFRLTAAEIRMCEQLLDNKTLFETAEKLSITRETARHRLKQIFQKTDTSRQAELIALLVRLS